MAPLEHHIEVYLTIAGDGHSKLQSPPSEGEGNPHSLTGNPHPGGNTPHCLQADLGNLTDQKLWQLMEDLHQEITLHKLHAPPNPQPTPWGEPSGNGNLKGDDPEVTFPRGGRWVPLRQPSPALAKPGGRWVPQEPPPQPLRPAPTNPDVGHLINTLASGLHLGTPRINIFSGSDAR